MHDPREIAADPGAFKRDLERRHAGSEAFAAVEQICAQVAERVAIVSERDNLRGERNATSKEIGALMKSGAREQAEARKADVARINTRIEAIEAQLAQIETSLEAASLVIPNRLADDVPEGRSDADNVEVSRWGEPRELGFEPKDHTALGEALGILDMERAAKLTGARFYALTGLGARLERALTNLFLDLHTQQHGYTEASVPYLVHDRIARGTGQLPKFAEDMFKLADPLNGAETYLIPTAEVPLTNLHRDEIVEESALPLKYTAFTPCFRSEAGSAGRDTRGMLRVHQFQKVELVWLTTAAQGPEAHESLVGHAERCLQLLELPYRKVLLCAGDTGFSARRCYDLEVWLPSQHTYREVSSCSYCGDFQGRRMNGRYRPSDPSARGKLPFVHTLNGSGLAVGRALLAVLENHQQADGSIRIPEALQRYFGAEAITARV